jgi:hypothetical protein
MWWVVNATPRYPLYRRLGGPQNRSGRVRKISTPNGGRSQDRPARSESLYRLPYPVPALTQVQLETSLPGNRNEVLQFVAQYIVVDTYRTEYYPWWWKTVQSMGKIPFVSVSKLGLSLNRSSRNLRLLIVNCIEIFCAEYHPDRSRNVCITGRESWLSLSRFPRNSLLLDSFLSPLPDFIKILQTV